MKAAVSNPLRTMSIETWRAKAVELGNGDMIDCRFRCPLCGNIASPRDFKEAGAKDPGMAATNCIGRVVGAKGNLSSKKPVPQPCDWAAYGLFGTLNSGIEVEFEDGKKMLAFDFADEVPS